MNFKTFLGLAVISCTVIPALSACSTNPATGRQQFAALMSPTQEDQVGSEEHPNIIAQYGEYNNARVQTYVRQVGARVTQNTERPDVQYKFYVIDSPIVNAFALPGGYIYISRGLLAVAQNEAELAAVLGHEAGHITGRHSAERYSRGVVTSLGTNILAAALDSSGVSQALGIGSDLYLKSYSRSQENEADTLGIRYLAQSGYSPDAMAGFLQALQNESAFAQLENGQQGGNSVSYFSTHPATADRIAKTASEVAAVQGRGNETGRDAYLNAIDGITYGESPAHGVIRGTEFIHPDIGFKFAVPSGFKLVNQPAQVIATSADGAAVIFDLAARTANQDAMGYLRTTWLKGEAVSGAENISVNGMNAATAAFAGSINNVPMTIRVVAIEFAPQRFARFQIGIPNNASAALVDGLKRTTHSFARLSESEKASFKPFVLRVVSAAPGDTVASLAAGFPYDKYNAERFRMLNGLGANDPVVAGARYKIIRAQ